MNIQLIQGEFAANEAMELITQLIHLKIKYHESKINHIENVEDIKCRETKIKRLQKELYELRNGMAAKKVNLKMDAVINIETN